MRAIILGAFLISGCTIHINSHNSTPTVDIASAWVGSHQSYDRAALREFMGIDPVRVEWCAAFVNSVLAEAGIPGSNSVHEYPLLARSFLDWGTAVNPEDILLGDLVVFPRGRTGWQGHVGFFVETQTVDGVLYWAILGGNQDNSVTVDLYPASRAIAVRRWIDTEE